MLTTHAVHCQVALDLSNTQFITVQNLSVAYAREYGIYGLNVENVTVDGVKVFGNGDTGVYLDGTGSGIRGSEVHHNGCKGARVSGGDVFTLAPGDMFAVDNYFHHHAQWKRTYQPGKRALVDISDSVRPLLGWCE